MRGKVPRPRRVRVTVLARLLHLLAQPEVDTGFVVENTPPDLERHWSLTDLAPVPQSFDGHPSLLGYLRHCQQSQSLLLRRAGGHRLFVIRMSSRSSTRQGFRDTLLSQADREYRWRKGIAELGGEEALRSPHHLRSAIAVDGPPASWPGELPTQAARSISRRSGRSRTASRERKITVDEFYAYAESSIFR